MSTPDRRAAYGLFAREALLASLLVAASLALCTAWVFLSAHIGEAAALLLWLVGFPVLAIGLAGRILANALTQTLVPRALRLSAVAWVVGSMTSWFVAAFIVAAFMVMRGLGGLAVHVPRPLFSETDLVPILGLATACTFLSWRAATVLVNALAARPKATEGLPDKVMPPRT